MNTIPGYQYVHEAISINNIIQFYCLTGPLAERVECFLMAQRTMVQSLVESYQRLKKWYLVPPCLTLSIIVGDLS